MSNDFDFESTESRVRKRMLPSVAEVARELSRRTAADAASILTSARKVCAEELIRVKDGHESAPVDVLVERALALLNQDGPPALDLPAPPPPAPAPFAFDLPSSVPGAPADPADPFAETTGQIDLRWDAGADAAGVLGQQAPSAQAPFEMSFTPPEPAPPPKVESQAAAPPSFGFNLDEAFASAPAGSPAGGTAEPGDARDGRAPAPFQPHPASRSRLPFFAGAAILALAAAGASFYFLKPSRPAAPPAPLAVKRKPQAPPAAPPSVDSAPPSSAAPEAAFPSSAAPASAAAAVASATMAAAAPPTPALPATPTWMQPGAAQPSAPVKSAAAEKPAAKPPALAVAPEAQPVTVATAPAPKAQPVVVAPEPVRVQTKPLVEAPKAAARKEEAVPGEAAARPKTSKVPVAPSATQEQTRAGQLVTPDWTGAPVFVVHFSSFQEKARTEKHAAVLAKQLGVPVRAVAVDLGEKGIWYRSVAGEFANPEDAFALRNDLLAKGTPGVGLVYKMSAKK